MLARSIDSHRQLGRLKDKEWLNSALTFLKAWAIVGGSGGPQALALPLGADVASTGDRKAYLEGLMKDIIENARALSERKPVFIRIWVVAPHRSPALVVESHPAFSIRILGNATSSDKQDGSFLEVLVQNHLPCVSIEYAFYSVVLM